MKRMLIVEDDNNLIRGITFAFEKDGFSVMSANTILDGHKKFEQHHIDIVMATSKNLIMAAKFW